MTNRAAVCAVVLSVALVVPMTACDGPSPTMPNVPPARPAPPAATEVSLSGQVFDLTPEGRIPAAAVLLGVSVLSGNCPGNPCTTTHTWRTTETGPDGRYSFSSLPAGTAALRSLLGTHRQVCGAFTPLRVSTQLDLEITSKANPQLPLALAPLRITGQVYEATAAGRIGVAGALVYFDWAWETFFFGVEADGDGRYAVCGIPPNWQMGTAAWQDGYDEAYSYRYFNADTTLDFELKRSR